jgi:hypothetical protein
MSSLDFRAYREVGLDLWGHVGRLAIWQEGLHVAHYPQAAVVRLRDDSATRQVSSGFVGSSDAKGIVRTRLSYGDLKIRQY